MFSLAARKLIVIASSLFYAILLTFPASGESVKDVEMTSDPESVISSVVKSAFPSSRNPRKWPFDKTSIWNMPIGTDAKYVKAGIQPSSEEGMFVDEDIIILRPAAPKVSIYKHDAGWDSGRIRCASIDLSEIMYQSVPIPNAFCTDCPESYYTGLTPNHAAAILMPDKVTIKQTQPFHRCRKGGNSASQYTKCDDNIQAGLGLCGARGGSGLSSLGGTIRVGELVPGGTIRHALKINIYGKKYLYYNVNEADGKPGYRWPAVNADSYAGDPISGIAYGGTNPALQMGSLLALKPGFRIGTLRTAPAKIIARALKNYGGYVVDDSAWDVYAFGTEWGPDGRVIKEFQDKWGFPFETSLKSTCSNESNECKWAKDMADIFVNLHVINNNSKTNVGGPGKRRAPYAPPFM